MSDYATSVANLDAAFVAAFECFSESFKKASIAAFVQVFQVLDSRDAVERSNVSALLTAYFEFDRLKAALLVDTDFVTETLFIIDAVADTAADPEAQLNDVRDRLGRYIVSHVQQSILARNAQIKTEEDKCKRRQQQYALRSLVVDYNECLSIALTDLRDALLDYGLDAYLLLTEQRQSVTSDLESLLDDMIVA